ncbi:uncharacterized protein B0P05DRAFT_473596, partial [Gilbertella persicaria]|uniref:uncharacterized protein n=1 Tax=Gilbertella persicaria TaxID=101096 RepID=UPI0022205168
DIDELIAFGGYRYIYSTEPYLVQQLWSVVKNKVKIGRTLIAGACNNVPVHHLKTFVQHSWNQFDKCSH